MTDLFDNYLSEEPPDALLAAYAEQAGAEREQPETIRAEWRKLAANPVEKNVFPIERWLAQHAVANGVAEADAYAAVREVLRAHAQDPDTRESYEQILEDLRVYATAHRQFEER